MYRELKINEVEIAKKLKITPSAVSRYLKRERGVAIEITNFKDIDKELTILAKDIATQNLDFLTIEIRLLKISILAMSKKYLCEFHHKIHPSINPTKCKICPEVFSTTKPTPKQKSQFRNNYT